MPEAMTEEQERQDREIATRFPEGNERLVRWIARTDAAEAKLREVEEEQRGTKWRLDIEHRGHNAIASALFAAGIDTPDGTSVGAVIEAHRRSTPASRQGEG